MFDVEGARKEGYNDLEIAQYLSTSKKFDYQGAIKEGYSDSEIIGHLEQPKPSIASIAPRPLRPTVIPSLERPEERGIVGTIGTALARGVVGLPSEIGAGIETVGTLIGSETLKRAGERFKTATEVPTAIQEAKELEGMEWYKPKKLASIIGEALPLMIGSAGTGIAARLGLGATLLLGHHLD